MNSLYTIFFGANFNITLLLEIVFRTSFMYLYTILNLRIIDKRSLGMLTPFEMIIIIALGAAVSDPMVYPSVPLIYGMAVITIIVFLEHLTSKISSKSSFLNRIINGKPILLIENGVLKQEVLNNLYITQDELYSICRLHGITNIEKIEYAYLEPSGDVSIIRNNGNHDKYSTTYHRYKKF